jgi:hypothetical protein
MIYDASNLQRTRTKEMSEGYLKCVVVTSAWRLKTRKSKNLNEI